MITYTARLIPKSNGEQSAFEPKTTVDILAKAVGDSSAVLGYNNESPVKAVAMEDSVSLNLPVPVTIGNNGVVEFQGAIEGEWNQQTLGKLRDAMEKTYAVLQKVFPDVKYNGPTIESGRDPQQFSHAEWQAIGEFATNLGLRPEQLVVKRSRSERAFYV